MPSALKCLVSALLMQLVSATPVASTYSCVTYVDTFDKVTPPTPIGIQNGLQYTGPIAEAPIGVTAQSPPNAAAATTATDLTAGAVTLSPFIVISTTGTTKAFNLNSFYYGCTGTPTGTGVPESCAISVYGYTIAGTPVTEVTYTYLPINEVSMGMNFAVLPASYVGLKNVTIVAATFTATGGTTTLLVDNVSHCNYS